ncbi:hypothetical protein Lal_00015097 [Lupinus albus]|nr:hypothetical protein Lal_00015097 [Lupinus albus]
MFREEQEPCFPSVETRRYTSHGPRTHANTGGSRLNFPSWCSKCNRKHDERLCSGTTKHCFPCKETGHIKRHCPMSRQTDGPNRCGVYEEKVNESQRSYTLTGVHRNHGDLGLRPTIGGFQLDVSPMYSKCGRKHVGTICPCSGNGCFHCKEKGHIKRFCPRLTQRVNVVEVRRPSTTGQVSTVSGTDTTDVDGFIRGNRMVTVFTSDLVVSTPKSVCWWWCRRLCSSVRLCANKVVAVGDLCEISDQASGMGPVSAKRVRTPLRKKGGSVFIH